jgi:beta-glucanase (GH16 family)
MRSTLLSAAAVALAVAQLCAAQTFTSCDPTKKSELQRLDLPIRPKKLTFDAACPADKALGKTITVDFTKGASSEFNLAEGTTLTYDGTNGAQFTINKETDAPTITSNWYIFFGKVDVVLKAAPGQGIVSSFVMESDDLDEIDWEWLGGDTTQVETNYFGKGNTTTYDRATYVSVASPQDTFHTYTVDWTAQAIKWSIDGNVIRTLAYDDANGGSNYPQTPMQVKMGNWVGGSSTAPQGTVEWAGGLADFSNGKSFSDRRSICTAC